MNKRGFTLIELLAVIVILAIIALIATPIILSIINDSRESAGLRSAEMYLKGVETSVATATINNKKLADGTYPITPKGDICLVKLTNNKCEGDNNTLEVEINGETPTSGSVTIVSGKVTDIAFTYPNEKTIIKDSEGNLVYGEAASKENKFADICTYDNTSGVAEKTAGAKYLCEVKPGTNYNFYVLTTPEEDSEIINLIMDQNINSDGTLAGITGITKNGENVYNLVVWQSNSFNKYGPSELIQFLYEATNDWINIPALNYIYNDKEVQEITVDGIGYLSFISTKGIVVLQNLESTITIGTDLKPLRTRLPIYSKDSIKTEVLDKTKASYLYDNIGYGYWTLSSTAGGPYAASYVYQAGGIINKLVKEVGGVRPVITLKM